MHVGFSSTIASGRIVDEFPSSGVGFSPRLRVTATIDAKPTLALPLRMRGTLPLRLLTTRRAREILVLPGTNPPGPSRFNRRAGQHSSAARRTKAPAGRRPSNRRPAVVPLRSPR